MTTTDISFAPSSEHVEKVCQPGKGEVTCRFLTMGAQGFICAKFSSLMKTLNEKAERGEMISKGNNCNALLDEVFKAKNELVGKRIQYIERMPTIEITGSLKDITINNNFLILYFDTEMKIIPFEINLSDLELINYGSYFYFSVAGFGAYCGSVKIFKY